jgi:hypothetical protein
MGEKSQGMVRRENRNAEEISEREEQDEVQPGQLLLPGRLFELQISGPEEEIFQ